jgi:catechol 2,3-dioxygenase-like lactoylglutathione lyase family enzyme
MPSSLSHLFVPVRDLEAARGLYVDLLGLEVLVDEDGYVRIGGGGGFTMGIEAEPNGEIKQADLVIRVDDVDETVARLRAAGIETTDPEDQPWGARHAWLYDPDGRPISIYAPVDPRPDTPRG